jgi:hypothetical protein
LRHASFGHPVFRECLLLVGVVFRPVTEDHSVPGYAENGGVRVMPGTRKNPGKVLPGRCNESPRTSYLYNVVAKEAMRQTEPKNRLAESHGSHQYALRAILSSIFASRACVSGL